MAEPLSGFFTFIHHDGPLIEWSDDITVRRMEIDLLKPEHERATRHRCIVRVPEERLPRLYAAMASYMDVAGPAFAEYELVWKLPVAECRREARPAWIKFELTIKTHKEEYARVEREILADPATLALIRDLIPNCPWDGQSILPTVIK